MTEPAPVNEKWYANRVVFALVCHFGYGKSRLTTEYDIDGGRADMLVITEAGYAVEIEVKVTLADWNNDQHKDKFKRERKYIRRFYYAVPETLLAKMPAWIPEEAGILVIESGGAGRDRVRVHRPGKMRKAEKMTPYMVERLYRKAYFSFWDMKFMALMRETENTKRRVA